MFQVATLNDVDVAFGVMCQSVIVMVMRDVMIFDFCLWLVHGCLSSLTLSLFSTLGTDFTAPS